MPAPGAHGATAARSGPVWRRGHPGPLFGHVRPGCRQSGDPGTGRDVGNRDLQDGPAIYLSGTSRVPHGCAALVPVGHSRLGRRARGIRVPTPLIQVRWNHAGRHTRRVPQARKRSFLRLRPARRISQMHCRAGLRLGAHESGEWCPHWRNTARSRRGDNADGDPAGRGCAMRPGVRMNSWVVLPVMYALIAHRFSPRRAFDVSLYQCESSGALWPSLSQWLRRNAHDGRT